MVYRFILLSDEVDNFRREILIDSDATFFDLHNAILDSVGYQKDQMSSFFICDEDWVKEKEITLVEMDTSSEEDNYVMNKVLLSELLEDEGQRLVYVFDYFTERAFYMEFKEIIPGKSLEKAECIKSVGTPPVQTMDFEEFEAQMPTPNASNSDANFFDASDDFNIDEYDEEDLDNLSEGNPFESY
ncbi:hypothetical protein FACS1894123_00460 [Bacteroidia bacterium]|nr:hypothetical protein FACS1894123_00460 [Bacteroidia bacterium]